jgi:hypothetical protein
VSEIVNLTARLKDRERERMKSCVRILADATDAMRDLGATWEEIAGVLRWAADEEHQ